MRAQSAASPTMKRLDQKAAELKLVQFTDPHLFADPRGEMRGVNTLDSLNRTLAAARLNHWAPDALLVTGDIAQDESRESYRLLRSVLEPLSLPVLCIPGNHDDPGFMQDELDGDFVLLAPVAFEHWGIVQLSTYVRGSASGELDRAALDSLDKVLADATRPHFLVCLHHQPVPVGSRWLDGVGLRNPDSFFEVLDRHDNVRGVLWGHVHQQFDGERKGVRLMGSPSTCRQFMPRHDEFALDDRPPGYRWLSLAADGSITTGVEYV